MTTRKQIQNNLKIIVLLCVITILPHSITPFSDNVFAQEPKKQLLKVSPYIFTVRLSPGTEYTYDLTIENLQNFPVPLHIETEDFVIQDETGEYSFGDNNANSLLNWLDIPTRDMILEPRETKELSFTVKTPSEIPFGGYHGMIFLEPRIASLSNSVSQLNTRIGVPIIASIGSTAYQVNPLRIIDVTVPTFITKKDEFNYALRIQNNSLFHTTAKPILILKPLWGDHTEVFLDEKLLFPGKTRFWEGSIPNKQNFTPNIYSTTLVLPIGNGNSITQKSHLIYIPVLFIISILFLTFATITYILHKQQKIHFKRFFETLLKG